MIENQTEQCSICLEDMEEELIYFGCHTFHKECIKNFAKAQLDAAIFPIKCPDEECKNSVDFEAIRSIQSQELQEYFLEFSLKDYMRRNAQNIVHCPTPNCSFTFEYEFMCNRPLGPNKCFGKKCPECNKYFCKCVRQIICEQCAKPICVICKDSHKGLSCYQHNFNKNLDHNFNAFVKFIKQAKFKKCPDCNFWVEKSMGCDHMTCRCGKQFCYRCNGEYLKCACYRGVRNPSLEGVYPREVRAYVPLSEPRNKPKPKAQTNKQILKPKEFVFQMPIYMNRSFV